MQETPEMQVLPLVLEDPLWGGNDNPLQCSCLGNPMDREPGGLQSMRSQRVRTEWLSTHIHTQFYHQYLHFTDEETEVQSTECHVGILHLEAIHTLKYRLLTFVLKVRVRRRCASQDKSTLIPLFKRIFGCKPFLSLYWICYNTALLLSFGFFFCLFLNVGS